MYMASAPPGRHLAQAAATSGPAIAAPAGKGNTV